MNSCRITEGLQKTPRDEKDFPFGAVFGHAALKDLPLEYRVADPIVIKDQGQTDMCTAYALTAVSEDQEGIALDPFFTFGQTKKITGETDAWGADLRSACKAGVVGFLPVQPGKMDTITLPPTQELRDAAAASQDVTEEERAIARRYAKRSFFSVSGPYDPFDNMRSAMWVARAERRSIFTGCDWRETWTDMPEGVVDELGTSPSFGHAVKVFGWESEPAADDRLLLQLSNGTDIGKGGIFSLRRDVVNQAFSYGAFTFMDMPREDAEAALQRSRKGILSTFFPFTFCRKKTYGS
jgi:hypothetical protein